jgi:signal transduction histidine kinase
LIQIVINLIKNAIDAIDKNPEGTKKLEINLSEEPDFIVLTVSDSGEGFDSEIESKIFERGFSTKEQGMGIGLSTGKEVAASHGGDLLLTSGGKGKGATATLKLAKKA